MSAFPVWTAQATTNAPEPVIDRFSDTVGYRSSIQLAGHVTGRPAGVKVVLQRRFAHSKQWWPIDSATTGTRGRVAFRRPGPRYTGRYRFKTEQAKSNPVTIRVRPALDLELGRSDVMEGARVTVKGTLRPAVPGRTAAVSWRVEGEWRLIDRVKVGDGRFRQSLRVGSPGRRRVKVTFLKDSHNIWARAGDLLRVHRSSPATWYGPGFFGNRTACGQTYDRNLLGVAHRTLPCGTMVSALYKGRSVRVPVVDRGPYGHSQWDLTDETADRLGFSGRAHIGVLIRR
ncbi:MAG: hypothetical protein M3198_20115 [Actinomycetota bacterium]|nr:hypothetical protein [Actinomycetota bacterium]